MKSILLLTTALCLPLFADEFPPPDSIEPMNQRFERLVATGTLRVAIVGSGSSHHFPKDFLHTDSKTLEAGIEKVDVVATPNFEEAMAFLKAADVLVFSGNHQQWGRPKFQKALNEFADAGKGLVMLHAATWVHPWKGYNERFIGGRTPSHGKGDFEVTVKDPDHSVTDGVPGTFDIWDENYRFQLEAKDRVHVCCENQPDQTDGPIPSVWEVKDPKAKIICITLGHDHRAHENKAFQKLLINAVNYVGGR